MKFIFEQVFAQRKDNGKKIFMNRCSCPASYGTKNLLCVHGLTSSNHVFDLDYKDYSVARYFARNGYTVWCMDYGGYGLSDKYENGFDVDTQNAAEDIIAAAEEICARQHVSALNLIGWSWGSMTSARASAARPELFHKMSWVGPCFGGTLPVTEVKDPFTTLSYPYCVRVFQRVNNSDTEVDYTTVEHGLVSLWVEQVFKKEFDMNIIRVNAADRFFSKLSGVTDPERKRKIIGEEFVRVFEAESEKLGKMDFLCQGTIYPDVVESGTGQAAVIKSHHNVGGLPEDIGFEGLVEPLRDLFKDEVRRVGLELGIPSQLVWRQPFPGPGLAVRIMGEVTPEKVKLLQGADAIFREEVANAGLERSVNQYFAVLTANRSVGVMGDGRTYGVTVALRAVTTTDFMTADWAHLPYDLLGRTSNRIINEVEGVNRVVYDITSKPPATIEWE